VWGKATKWGGRRSAEDNFLGAIIQEIRERPFNGVKTDHAQRICIREKGLSVTKRVRLSMTKQVGLWLFAFVELDLEGKGCSAELGRHGVGVVLIAGEREMQQRSDSASKGISGYQSLKPGKDEKQRGKLKVLNI